MLAVTHMVKGKHNPAMQKGISLASNLVQHGLHVQYVKYCSKYTSVMALRSATGAILLGSVCFPSGPSRSHGDRITASSWLKVVKQRLNCGYCVVISWLLPPLTVVTTTFNVCYI